MGWLSACHSGRPGLQQQLDGTVGVLQVGKEVEDVLSQALKPAMMTNVRERFAKDPPSGSGTARKERRRAPAAKDANGSSTRAPTRGGPGLPH